MAGIAARGDAGPKNGPLSKADPTPNVVALASKFGQVPRAETTPKVDPVPLVGEAGKVDQVPKAVTAPRSPMVPLAPRGSKTPMIALPPKGTPKVPLVAPAPKVDVAPLVVAASTPKVMVVPKVDPVPLAAPVTKASMAAIAPKVDPIPVVEAKVDPVPVPVPLAVAVADPTPPARAETRREKHERIFNLQKSDRKIRLDGSEAEAKGLNTVKPTVKPAFVPLPVPAPVPVPPPAPAKAISFYVANTEPSAFDKKRDDLFGENFSGTDDYAQEHSKATAGAGAGAARPTTVVDPTVKVNKDMVHDFETRSELFPAPRTAGNPRVPGSPRYSQHSALGVGPPSWGSSSGNGKTPSGLAAGTAQRTGGHAAGPSSWHLSQAAGPTSWNGGNASGPPSWSPMTPPPSLGLAPDGSRPNITFDSTIYQPYSLNGGEGNMTAPSSSSLHHRSSPSVGIQPTTTPSPSPSLPHTLPLSLADPAIRSRRQDASASALATKPMKPIEPPKRGVTSYFQFGRQASFKM